MAVLADMERAGVKVDTKLLAETHDGPPWAVEWTDENPFEPREIAAEVSDTLGRTARETVWAVALPLARPALGNAGALRLT